MRGARVEAQGKAKKTRGARLWVPGSRRNAKKREGARETKKMLRGIRESEDERV